MNQPYEPVTEIDLLAYADGGLTGDPQRLAEVERYLRDTPEMAARVEAFIRQNAEIRALYNPVLYEQVPERLRATLVPVSRQWQTGLLRGAVAAMILFSTGVAGWYIGRNSTDAVIWQRDAVIHSTLSSYWRTVETSGDIETITPENATYGTPLRDPQNGVQLGVIGRDTDIPLGTDGDSRSTSWLSGHVALQMRLPDLSGAGFQMVGNQTIETDTGNAIRVNYVGETGRKLVLMLHPRWRTGVSDIEIDQREGITIASWADGPLAYGVASDSGAQKIFDLARKIRDAMREPGTSKPELASGLRSFPQINGPQQITPEGSLTGDLVPQHQSIEAAPLIDEPAVTGTGSKDAGATDLPVYQ